MKKPAHFNRRSWQELRRHFETVSHVAARLRGRQARASDTTLFATIAAIRAQPPYPTMRQVLVRLVREMRAAKQPRAREETCAYCGDDACARRTDHGRMSGSAALDDEAPRGQ
jgi:hypothetical protein